MMPFGVTGRKSKLSLTTTVWQKFRKKVSVSASYITYISECATNFGATALSGWINLGLFETIVTLLNTIRIAESILVSILFFSAICRHFPQFLTGDVKQMIFQRILTPHFCFNQRMPMPFAQHTSTRITAVGSVGPRLFVSCHG
jgi:hypothetical protein